MTAATDRDTALDALDAAAAWHDGYSAGHNAALAARPRRDVFLPVERAWRHLQPGDTFVGKGGALWHLASTNPGRGTIGVVARHGGREFTVDVDPDELIPVLVQRPEHDALELLAEQLGATMIGQAGASP